MAELSEATKERLDISKSHINITKHTIVTLIVTTPTQTTTMQFMQANTNAGHLTQMIRLVILLVKHVHLKVQKQILKILKTTMTVTILIATLTLHHAQNDYHELMTLLRSN